MLNCKIMKFKLTIINCITPLLIGGILYIIFRSKTLIMFDWFSNLGIDNFITSMRSMLFNLKNYLPSWTYYSLPDGLWIYAFNSALLILWNGKLTLWLLPPVLGGTIVELAQGIKIFPGTFDILDLFFSLLAFSMSTIIINHKFNQHEKILQ